jgi:hypothetical protein
MADDICLGLRLTMALQDSGGKITFSEPSTGLVPEKKRKWKFFRTNYVTFAKQHCDKGIF